MIEWIDVKDRLPQEHSCVLAFFGGDQELDYQYERIVEASMWCGRWYYCNDIQNWMHIATGVTHWAEINYPNEVKGA